MAQQYDAVAVDRLPEQAGPTLESTCRPNVTIGNYTAIQCKFPTSRRTLAKGDIDFQLFATLP